MSVSILCIGHASYDIFFPLDNFPEEDQKHTVELFLDACGGPAANAAYLLGMWGASCGFAGCIGGDGYGEKAAGEFARAGVNVDLLERKKDHHTPLSCIIINTSNGSRTIINRRNTTYQMKIERESLKKMEPGFLLFDGHEHKASLLALNLFPDSVSVLDAGSLRPATEDLSGKVTHLLCSERFARDITGVLEISSDSGLFTAARRLMKINPKPGCFTLGCRGLVFWEEGAVFHLPAFHVIARDTTGAGDIFHGAFLYFLSRDMEFRDALIYGSASAALSTMRYGGRQSIPDRNDVETFINESKKRGDFPVFKRLP